MLHTYTRLSQNHTLADNLIFLSHFSVMYVPVRHPMMRTINKVKRRTLCIPHAHPGHHKNNTQLTVNNYIWEIHQQATAGNVKALCNCDPRHISITTHLVQLQHKFLSAVEYKFDAIP